MWKKDQKFFVKKFYKPEKHHEKGMTINSKERKYQD